MLIHEIVPLKVLIYMLHNLPVDLCFLLLQVVLSNIIALEAWIDMGNNFSVHLACVVTCACVCACPCKCMHVFGLFCLAHSLFLSLKSESSNSSFTSVVSCCLVFFPFLELIIYV